MVKECRVKSSSYCPLDIHSVARNLSHYSDKTPDKDNCPKERFLVARGLREYGLLWSRCGNDQGVSSGGRGRRWLVTLHTRSRKRNECQRLAGSLPSLFFSSLGPQHMG